MNVADVIQDRCGDFSVGRVDDFQLDGNLPCAPFVNERLCFLFVDLNGDRGQCAGVGGAGKGEGLQAGQDKPADRDDRVDAAGQADPGRGRGNFGGDAVVMAWMPCMVTKSSGMAMVTIHAPWVNFVIKR